MSPALLKRLTKRVADKGPWDLATRKSPVTSSTRGKNRCKKNRW